MAFLQGRKLHFWTSAFLNFSTESHQVHTELSPLCSVKPILSSVYSPFKDSFWKKSQRYKIYIHKGTAILLKRAMLQYNRVPSVPFMQQSSLTNLNPLPLKLTAQVLYLSLSVKRISSYYLINSKVTTGTWKKYIKCFFFLPKFARLASLFLIKRK